MCVLLNFWMRYFENELTDTDANLHNWSKEKGHEMINFGGQEVKG